MKQTTTLRNDSLDKRRGRAAEIGGHVLARWPSVVGLLALLANITGRAESHLTAMIIIIAAMCYLGAAALGFRGGGWVMVGIGAIAVLLAGGTGADKTVTLLVLGVVLGIVGWLRGDSIDRRELVLQFIAFVGFSGIALTAMMSSPLLAAHLAALAAIGHAAWDVAYFVREKVVARSLAEACFVLDLGLGVVLLLTAWNVISF